MALERAAHVKMPVTHGSHAAQNTATVGAGVAAFLLSGGTAALGAALAAAATWIGIGGTAGKLTDKFVIGDTERGKIVDGAVTVLVGEERQRAANADPQKNEAGCDNMPILEGSKEVYAERWNFSRKNDKTECGGKIADGCPTVHIGGDGTRKGVYVRDRGTTLDTAIDVAGQTVGVVTAKGWIDRILGLVGIGATVTGNEALGDAVSLTKAGRGYGNSTLDAIDAAGSVGTTGMGAYERYNPQ